MTTPKLTPATFVQLLRQLPSQPDVFNPWLDFAPANDFGPEAPGVRARQLEQYLALRVPTAKLVVVAEAPGWHGAKFTGIAMTSERMVLDGHPDVRAQYVLGVPGLRTSKHESGPSQVERTATIVWGWLLAQGLKPADFVLWNAVPVHPHDTGNPRSNRSPRGAELASTAHVLEAFLSMLEGPSIIAVGNQARDALLGLGVSPAAHVPHPTGRNNAITRFRAGMKTAFAEVPALSALVSTSARGAGATGSGWPR